MRVAARQGADARVGVSRPCEGVAMFWQVRAVLEDRPGAMAALAGLCGEHDINILGLQIFPAAGDRWWTSSY